MKYLTKSGMRGAFMRGQLYIHLASERPSFATIRNSSFKVFMKKTIKINSPRRKARLR
jgi:hypothetical protein